MPSISLTLSRGGEAVVWEDCEVTFTYEEYEPDTNYGGFAVVESVKFSNPNRPGTWHELALTAAEMSDLDERVSESYEPDFGGPDD